MKKSFSLFGQKQQIEIYAFAAESSHSSVLLNRKMYTTLVDHGAKTEEAYDVSLLVRKHTQS